METVWRRYGDFVGLGPPRHSLRRSPSTTPAVPAETGSAPVFLTQPSLALAEALRAVGSDAVRDALADALAEDLP